MKARHRELPNVQWNEQFGTDWTGFIFEYDGWRYKVIERNDAYQDHHGFPLWKAIAYERYFISEFSDCKKPGHIGHFSEESFMAFMLDQINDIPPRGFIDFTWEKYIPR